MIRKSLFTAGLVALSLLLSSIGLAGPAEEEAEKAARKTVEDFFEAFNRADNEALQKYMNYPHIFLTRNGQARVIEGDWTMSFDRMREREGWARSSIVSLEAVFVLEDKVHFKMVFSRHKDDGSVYRTVPGEWVETKQDGHWGVQLRSY